MIGVQFGATVLRTQANQNQMSPRETFAKGIICLSQQLAQ